MSDVIRDFIFASSHQFLGRTDGSVILKFQARAPEFIDANDEAKTKILADTVYKDLCVQLCFEEANELVRQMSDFLDNYQTQAGKQG